MVTHRKRGKIFHVDFLKGRVHVVRGSLGTRNEAAARTLIHRIEIAIAAGAMSSLWVELSRVLPEKTFIRFANYVGVQANPLTTWSELRAKYEADMDKRVQINDFAESTQLGYQKAIQNFEDFLTSREHPIYLVREINRNITRDYKYSRIAAIQKRKGPNGGNGYANEAATLHRLFEFGIESGIISENPFHSEPKIRDPKGGAQPYSGVELRQMREHAGEDRLLFLVFRHTGLRSCDIATLIWPEINFEENRIEKRTQKSRYRIVGSPSIQSITYVFQPARQLSKLSNRSTSGGFASQLRHATRTVRHKASQNGTSGSHLLQNAQGVYAL